MLHDIQIIPLSQNRFNEAVSLVLKAGLDTKEEIEHHIQHIDAHYVAVYGDKTIGVIGWYQDNVHYADEAMGTNFPGDEAFWVGFFVVEKEYQGEGIGSALLHKLEEAIKDKKSSSLWVSSVPEARSYYEDKGFKLVCEGQIGGNHKYFMVKKL